MRHVKTLITSRANLSRPTDAKSAPVPVTITQVQKSDFPVYLLGLGTVQPYRTVTLRSRVDGQITKVSFKQGQMVKQGDPLIEIDHRPYQAALDEVKAKKQLDLATLANAQGKILSVIKKQERSPIPGGGSTHKRRSSRSNRPESPPTTPPSRVRKLSSITPRSLRHSPARSNSARSIPAMSCTHPDQTASCRSSSFSRFPLF